MAKKGGDILDCYGKRHGMLASCNRCEYAESCRWAAANPEPYDGHGRSRRGHFVSYEQYAFAREVAAEPDRPHCDEEARELAEAERLEYDTPIYSNEDLEAILRFLLREVDDYSLAVAMCVLREGHTMASETARAFGVSREAMHRKIVDSCRKFPVLAALLKGALYRCKKLSDIHERHNIAGRRNAGKAGQAKKQMELNFGNGGHEPVHHGGQPDGRPEDEGAPERDAAGGVYPGRKKAVEKRR